MRGATLWLARGLQGIHPGGRFQRFELEAPCGGTVRGIRAFGYDCSTEVVRLWLGERQLISCPVNPVCISDQQFRGCDRRWLTVAFREQLRCDVRGRAPEHLAILLEIAVWP